MTRVDEQPPHSAAAEATPPAPPPRNPSQRPRRRVLLVPGLRIRVTREKAVEWLKTMVWVAPLTVIIWIYAEREQIPPLPYPIDHVPVIVSTSSPNLYVEVSGDPLHFVDSPFAQAPQVSLKLTGPQEGLEKVHDELNSIPPEPLRIDLGSSLRPSQAPQRVNVANSIQNYPIFRSHGVSVLDASPPELLVVVDEVQETTIDIQLPPGIPNVDETATTIEPRQARLRGPARLLRGIAVLADLPKSVASLRPGVHVLNDVPLVLEHPDDRITIVPPRKVNVRLSILAPEETYILTVVTVNLEQTQTLEQGYDIKWDPSLTDVKVIGPPDKIEQLRNGTTRVRAVLELSNDDIGHSPKAVTFYPPEGIHIAPDSLNRTVAFTLAPRGG